MDTEQNSSLLDNIANIGAVTIGTIRSGFMAISTAIGLTVGNSGTDGKEIKQIDVDVQPYSLTKPGYRAPARDIESCKEQASSFGQAWNLQAGQTKEDHFRCKPDPDHVDYDPNAPTVDITILRTGDADPVVTTEEQRQPKKAPPAGAPTLTKR